MRSFFISTKAWGLNFFQATNGQIHVKTLSTKWFHLSIWFSMPTDLLSACPRPDISQIDRPGRISSFSWWFHIHWMLGSCIQCYLEEKRGDEMSTFFLKSQWSEHSALPFIETPPCTLSLKAYNSLNCRARLEIGSICASLFDPGASHLICLNSSTGAILSSNLNATHSLFQRLSCALHKFSSISEDLKPKLIHVDYIHNELQV